MIGTRRLRRVFYFIEEVEFMEKQLDLRQAVWTRYWSHGISHSCGGSFGDRYEGALARFWTRAFAGLGPGARVLDIATGNGALPQLLLAADDTGSVSCDAIDLARPEPHWLAGLPAARRAQVRFHGGQAAEQLPFGEHQFDMVVSQYGLEYTDLGRTVPELLRVLAPGGKVRLVTHHAAARPVLLAAAELQHLAWLDQAQGLLDTTAAMIEPMARAATAQGQATLARDAAANASRARFNTLQTEVTQLAAASDCPDVLLETRQAANAILQLALNAGAHTAEAALLQLRQDLADSAVRLRELRDYALDEMRARELCAALAGEAGAALLEPIAENAILMGWSISFDRP
jgi:SAM-dependent methyltransferase